MIPYHPTFILRTCAMLAVILIPLLGCSAENEATPATSSDTEVASSRTDPEIEKSSRVAFERKELERVPAAAETPVTGEIPADVMEKIFADLETRSGRDRSEFDVVRSMAMIWPNGALGCPEPGMVYTQAQVRGYWAVLELEGKSYDYRANERGFITLCDRAATGAPAR